MRMRIGKEIERKIGGGGRMRQGGAPRTGGCAGSLLKSLLLSNAIVDEGGELCRVVRDGLAGLPHGIDDATATDDMIHLLLATDAILPLVADGGLEAMRPQTLKGLADGATLLQELAI